MPRITVNLDEEQYEWVEQQAEERDRSKSFILAHLVDAERSDAHHGDAQQDDAGRIEVMQRLDDVERRLDELEGSGGDESPREEAPRERVSVDEAGGDGDEDADVGDDVEEAIQSLDLPGSGEKLERRREAVRTMYEYLRENGSAQRADFLELIDADDVRYKTVESFWSNAVKDRDALKNLPGVEAPGEGEHNWYYVG